MRVLVFLAAGSCALPVMAAAEGTVAAATASESQPNRPSPRLVRLRVGGNLPDEQVRALATLIEAELNQLELEFELVRASRPDRSWLEHAATEARVLMAASLDTEDAKHWVLYIADPLRGKITSRTLSGGSLRDAAAVEAVASIVISGASALAEGLELASKREPRPSAPRPSAPRPSAPRPSAPSRQPPPATGAQPPQTKAHDRAVRSLRFVGSVAFTVASFDSGTLLTLGPTLSLGLVGAELLSARLSGTRYLPAHMETELGTFKVARSQLGLTVAPQLSYGHLYFEPGVMAKAELLERYAAVAAEAVRATEGGQSLRWVLGANLGVGYVISRFLVFEIAVSAGYYLSPFSFTEALSGEAVATPFRFVISGSAGIGVRLP